MMTSLFSLRNLRCVCARAPMANAWLRAQPPITGSQCLRQQRLVQSSSEQHRDLSAAACDPTRLTEPDRLYSKIQLEMSAHDQSVLDSYIWFLRQSAEHLQLQVTAEPGLDKHETDMARNKRTRPHIARKAVLRAAFASGKHKVHYEVRTYSRLFQLEKLTGSTADTYLEYVQRMLPEGVAMKVVRHARQALPPHLTSASR